jgi:hypothetical protein
MFAETVVFTIVWCGLVPGHFETTHASYVISILNGFCVLCTLDWVYIPWPHSPTPLGCNKIMQNGNYPIFY